MNLSNKRIVATGLCGFIGNNFAQLLLEQNPAELVVIDKMTYVSNKDFHIKNDIHVIESDIADENMLEWIPKFKPDVIINMAAESHVDRSIEEPNIFVKSNVFGTVNLMNAALKMESMPLFVQISTDEIYGDIAYGWSVENDPRLASSPYSASKASAEMFVEAYGRTFKLPYLITRSSNNYGPYQDPEKFIPKAITNILKGKKVPVYGDGSQQRDWIYVKDNCKGILAAIEFRLNNYMGPFIFNIGGAETTTNMAIINNLCHIMNKIPVDVIEFVVDRPGHDKRYAISTKLIEEFCNWKPEMPLDTGLVKTIEWYKEKI